MVREPHSYKLTRSRVSSTGLMIAHYERGGFFYCEAIVAPVCTWALPAYAMYDELRRNGYPISMEK